jgi:ArsR family transcriptional regulator
MAFSKAHLFDPADQTTSAFLKALSHPVRLDILRTLSAKGPCAVETFFTKYPLSKSTISQHLEGLRKASLVKYREDHPHIIYSLDSQVFKLYNIKLQDFIKLLND